MDEPWIVLPAGAYVVPIPVGIMDAGRAVQAGDRDVLAVRPTGTGFDVLVFDEEDGLAIWKLGYHPHQGITLRLLPAERRP
jgi:hypothetical protein